MRFCIATRKLDGRAQHRRGWCRLENAGSVRLIPWGPKRLTSDRWAIGRVGWGATMEGIVVVAEIAEGIIDDCI